MMHIPTVTMGLVQHAPRCIGREKAQIERLPVPTVVECARNGISCHPSRFMGSVRVSPEIGGASPLIISRAKLLYNRDRDALIKTTLGGSDQTDRTKPSTILLA